MERRKFLALMGVSVMGSVACAKEESTVDIWVKEEHRPLLDSTCKTRIFRKYRRSW